MCQKVANNNNYCQFLKFTTIFYIFVKYKLYFDSLRVCLNLLSKLFESYFCSYFYSESPILVG